ncbi:MAG: NTP transferase domain-containing protein, partial [Pontimonas sp.]
MSDAALAVVVLAAGQGTRMKSSVAKVLHNLAGVPLIGHVVATAQALEPAHLAVVVRHQRDDVAQAVTELAPEAHIVDQDDVPGTGRALEVALEALPKSFTGDVVVVSGDVPLLDSDTLRAVIAHHRQQGAPATLISTVLDDPAGYGRVVRDDSGHVVKVVEERDATADEADITEVNAGAYVFQREPVAQALEAIGTHNAQGEKYLTDVVESLAGGGQAVQAIRVEDSWLLEGINDKAQLSDVHARLNRMIVRGWQIAGVTIVDPSSCFIDVGVQLAEDVTIEPGVQLRGSTVVDSGATIGPETTLLDTT